jgi:hypothetical protein
MHLGVGPSRSRCPLAARHVRFTKAGTRCFVWGTRVALRVYDMVMGTNLLSFVIQTRTMKNIYTNLKTHTIMNLKILSKLVPIGLAGIHGLRTGFISN